MTTCVYYEQEVVTADDVRAARALAGGDVPETAPSDASWPEGIDGPAPSREAGARSLQVLEEWLPRVSAWGEQLEASLPQVTMRQGISLAEVAKLELLFSLAAAVQRWQVVAGIRRRWNPDRLLWLTDRADGELAALCRAAAPLSIEVHRREPRRARASAWEALKARLAPPVERARAIATAAVRTPRWPSQRPDVVCAEYFPNSVPGSVMVAEKLQAQYGMRICWIAGRKKVVDALADRGIQSLLLSDLMSTRAHWRAGLDAHERRAIRASLRAMPDEMFGGQPQSGERAYLLDVLERRILRVWDTAAHWIDGFYTALSVIRPRALLSTTYSSSFGRAAALATRAFGGHAAYLQHGLFPRCSGFCSFCHDLLLMWGQNEYRILTDYGVDPGAIRVTGATIYDPLARRQSDASRDNDVGGKPFRVAFMASRTGGLMVSYAQAKACLLAVARAISHLEDAHLTVKIHPGDHTGMIEEVMRDFPRFAVLKSGRAEDVIVASDAVIVVSSTTGLEACVAGKPLMVLDVFDDPNSIPYAGYGAAVSVPFSSSFAADVEQALSQLRDDSKLKSSLAEGRQRLLDDMLNGAAGDAADQAARAVAEALGHCEAEPLVERGREGGVPPLQT